MSFLYSSPFAFKIICSLISVGCLSFIVFFLVKTKWLKFALLYPLTEFLTLKIYGSGRNSRAWNKIAKKINRGDAKYYKKAIIKADKILGLLLKNLVPIYQANNFAERLNLIGSSTFSNIDQLWQVHEMSEQLVGSYDLGLNREKTLVILKVYERALKDLEVL